MEVDTRSIAILAFIVLLLLVILLMVWWVWRPSAYTDPNVPVDPALAQNLASQNGKRGLINSPTRESDNKDWPTWKKEFDEAQARKNTVQTQRG